MKEGAPIRFLLVALPAGLFLLGILAMVGSHFRDKDKPLDPNEAIRLEAAALKRRPVGRDDLENSLEILTTRIGERHQGKPEALESAAVWVESTLGGGNIGYTVERQIYDAGGGIEARNLIAELPGRDRRAEIVVVGAHYDATPGGPGGNDNGSGIASLLALARAFTGDPQGRTIRFVAFANGAAPDRPMEARGSFVYANRCRARGEKIIVMLALDSLGDGLSISGAEDAFYFTDSARAAFSRATSISVQGGILPIEKIVIDHTSFTRLGYPAVALFGNEVPDTSGKIDLESLEETTRGIEAVLRAWANP